MSYARCNNVDSHVYVIDHVGGFFFCFCDRHGFRSDTRSGMIAHLQDHVARGDMVPQRAFDRLEREIAEVGDNWTPVQ